MPPPNNFLPSRAGEPATLDHHRFSIWPARGRLARGKTNHSHSRTIAQQCGAQVAGACRAPLPSGRSPARQLGGGGKCLRAGASCVNGAKMNERHDELASGQPRSARASWPSARSTRSSPGAHCWAEAGRMKWNEIGESRNSTVFRPEMIRSLCVSPPRQPRARLPASKSGAAIHQINCRHWPRARPRHPTRPAGQKRRHSWRSARVCLLQPPAGHLAERHLCNSRLSAGRWLLASRAGAKCCASWPASPRDERPAEGARPRSILINAN